MVLYAFKGVSLQFEGPDPFSASRESFKNGSLNAVFLQKWTVKMRIIEESPPLI